MVAVVSVVNNTGNGGRSASHRRSQDRQNEINAARADLARLDRASDEVLDVVAQRLWQAMNLDAEYDRIRRERASGAAAAPASTREVEIRVRPRSADALDSTPLHS